MEKQRDKAQNELLNFIEIAYNGLKMEIT